MTNTETKVLSFDINMKFLSYLFVIFIAVILQATLLDSFKIFGVKPDLLLIVIVITDTIFDLKWALCLGIFAGILKDSLGANVFGINTLLFPLWVFLIAKLSKKILLDSNFIRVMLIFIIGILHGIVTRLIFLALGNTIVSLGVFLRITFLESLYTAAILPLVFKFSKPLIYPVN